MRQCVQSTGMPYSLDAGLRLDSSQDLSRPGLETGAPGNPQPQDLAA